ncbi:MAG TPA: hypothetical protein VK901_02470, partial [Nitrospiraceae bacterium]|nr:hypothetical protein [Nitrospiraceae bacterium]
MATKRKQRQPNEDLEAAVAEILDNPIVKINLGFLNVGKPGGEEVSIGGGEEGFSGEYVPEPMGLASYSVGVGSGGADGQEGKDCLPVRSAPTSKGGLTQDAQHYSEDSPDQEYVERPKPMGVEIHPMGLDVTPAGVIGQTGIASKTNLDVFEGLAPPPAPSLKQTDRSLNFHPIEVGDTTPDGLETRPMGYGVPPLGVGLSQSMFLAEQLGTLFPIARVHRIRLAQDALSHVEEKVYDLLWGVKNQSRDSYRLSEFSLQRIANEGRLNIKTVRELLPRLIDKGFIAIEREADVRRNRPTQYRVWSYSEVLADQRRRNRLWFVKTGKGVFYARPVSVGVTGEGVH